MKIIPLGTGSAFTLKNYQTNLLIETKGQRLLIDAGGDLRFALRDQGLSYKDLNGVYITHLHSDHISGMEYLAFCSYFDPTTKPLLLFGHQRILEELWSSCLRGGLRSIQGKTVELRDYFYICPIRDNEAFSWETLNFKIVQSVHIMDGYSIVPSYGIMFKDPDTGKTVYITADGQFAPKQIQDFYNEADIIIQDCETAPFKSGVHAHYDELKTLSPETKAKMVLIHYQDNVVDNMCEYQKKARADEFKGFAEKGVAISLK